jgi:tRNA pseudouridine55 synthase
VADRRRREAGDAGPTIDGLVVVDKPAGWTSHDVVARCRTIFGQRKVGHAGTLDPDATGVLLVGLGRMTRLLRFLTDWPKSYRGEVVFGVATSTLDASGEVTGRWEMGHVTHASAEAAARQMTGVIAQVPPMVSAVKVGGRRLHDLARRGVVVERPARTVTVSRLTLVPAPDAAPGAHGGGPVFRMEVDCSSGTYVRSLAADLGALLGGGAHLQRLRRTAVGPFTQAEAVSLDALGRQHVLAPAAALPGLAAVTVDPTVAAAVGFGKILPRPLLGAAGDGPWAVLGPDGDLLAVYQARGPDEAKPAVVVRSAPPAGR